MIQYTYDREIQTMTTMMLNAISTIVIKRFNVNRQTRDQIKTRVVYAPKQRVLNDLLNRDQNLQLPVVAVSIGGITRDQNRVWNKLLGTYNPNPGYVSSNYERTPLPIDIRYNVTVMTRYQEDMDQIISHIIPYVNPYFVVSWRTPQRPDFEIRSNVFWDGNVNITYPFDLVATQVARIVADLSFTFKGWMFQAVQDPVANIHDVNATFTDVSQGIPTEFLLEANFQDSAGNSDQLLYKEVPPQPKLIEPYYARIGTFQQFNVWGAGFKKINNVYLSGAPLDTNMTLQNPFSSIPELSSTYPAFTAVKIDSAKWSYDRDKQLTFVMPSASNPGLLDVILEGPAGYGKLTEYTRINTFNPFLSTQPEYTAFVPYQMPYLSGIEIV